jgi:hypothetical protein
MRRRADQAGALSPANDRLVLACAGSRAQACAGTTLDALLLQHDIVWPALLRAGRRHNVLPLLYSRLKSVDAHLVPQSVVAELRSAYYTSLLRNQRLQGELAQAVGALQQSGITLIVLKGAALASTVYQDLALRPMSDLDILVHPADMLAVGATLGGIGFQVSGAIPPRTLAFQQQFGGGVEWVRVQGGERTRIDVYTTTW